ncbi:ADP-ribosylation factor-like protein 13A isoform X3 [Tachysurus vachellii]|uniref:ADP-ribosylation factor-like protein 13A isoform X3 n=1 Tax=Tachysurus vachellii TaxID=175792 RepID=UPI00296AB00C|nr:ADP-ribosylation factor-like protein 13A isoform X3 [Tachysurus vachellii]
MQINKDILLFESRRRWCSPPHLSMFHLMSNCCNWVFKLQQPMRNVTVLVVGLDKVGKTLCVRGMLRAPLGEVSPTHGCVHYEIRLENFLVNLLDTGGSPEFRLCWKEYYGKAHGVIFVVDSSDRHRIKEVKELLTDMLRHPKLAGKPLLVLANKQDKMNALLGVELIEVLSLEKLVNQSQSLCHVEPCSALIDLRRWSDRRTLRGLRWLLRAMGLDYLDLCARVVRDCGRQPGPEEREREAKAGQSQKKNKVERLKARKPANNQAQCPLEEQENSHLQPTILKENSFQKKMMKKKLKVKIKAMSMKKGSRKEVDMEQKEEEKEGNESEQDVNSEKDKSNSGLLPQKYGRLKPKAKVQTLDYPEYVEATSPKAVNGQNKKKKKPVKGKRKNRISSEEIPVNYRQPADLSATFGLSRCCLSWWSPLQSPLQKVKCCSRIQLI